MCRTYIYSFVCVELETGLKALNVGTGAAAQHAMRYTVNSVMFSLFVLLLS